MRFANIFVLLLVFTASTVQAQECPIANALPASLNTKMLSHKYHAAFATQGSDLSGDQQHACIADAFASNTQNINADVPFQSSIEEIWLGNNWINNSSIENEYNEAGQLINKTFLRWNTGLQKFSNETATHYTYDAGGNTSEVVTTTWNGAAFENQYRSVIERDTFGNLIMTERFDGENGGWNTRFLSTSVVTDELITETIVQTTHATGTLANVKRTTFEYDGEGRSIMELEERWDENTQSWGVDSRDLISYAGTTVVTTSQEYESGNWVDAFETTALYNDNGLLLEQTSTSLMTTGVGNRFIYTYDNAGNLMEMVAQEDDAAGGWRNQFRNAFTLDPDGDPLELLIQQYDNNGMMWANISRVTYNYEQNPAATGVEDEMISGLASVDLYPYPAKDRVHVSLQLTQSSELHVEVYDVLGRQVKNLVNGIMSAGTQRISWLPQNEPAGLYFVRITVDGAVNTRPILLIK